METDDEILQSSRPIYRDRIVRRLIRRKQFDDFIKLISLTALVVLAWNAIQLSYKLDQAVTYLQLIFEHLKTIPL